MQLSNEEIEKRVKKVVEEKFTLMKLDPKIKQKIKEYYKNKKNEDKKKYFNEKLFASKYNDIVKIGDCFDTLIEIMHWEKELLKVRIITSWKEIVGEYIAKNVKIKDFKNDTLYLCCSSTMWASKMRLLQAKMQRELDDYFNSHLVKKIKIEGPKAPKQYFSDRRIKGRGPRDTYG